jgi:antitoxin (DNA-binding transcriptional repressor) of toxin-antitoxin stability system
LLDRVEQHGEAFVVERRGRPVASIQPAPVANGRALKELLRAQEPDEEWARELAEVRSTVQAEERHWSG